MTPHKFTIPAHLCICRDPSCLIPYGKCHCTCGREVPVAYRDWKIRGWKKGVPIRYISGHSTRLIKTVETSIPFKIDGDPCRLIALTQGIYSIVDEDVYYQLGNRSWSARWSASSHTFYAHRSSSIFDDGYTSEIQMHREILGMNASDKRDVDHKNGVGVDNRRRNLRPATRSENSKNSRDYRNNTSGRKGVHLRKDTGKYMVYIRAGGRLKSLGSYETFDQACAIRDAAEKEYYGEFSSKASRGDF